jgi:hypothetical protein
MTKRTRKSASEKPRRKDTRALTKEQEHILEGAMTYCLHHFPMLWTTVGVPEERLQDDGSRHWIIHVYLRYPTGHAGYLGDLRYDGKTFTQLTDREVMRQRAKQIAADPERMRKWNEYRASTPQTGEG